MSTETTFIRTWRVGRYTAMLTCPGPAPIDPPCILRIEVAWEPSVPHDLTRAELDEYRAGRDAAVRDIARQFNFNPALIEI